MPALSNQILQTIDTINFRNRFAERAVYLLPTRDPNGDDPEIDQLGCSEAALKYMIKHQTLELPPNFFLRKVQKSSLFSTLRYTAYDVRDKFPNNIVRLEDGRIMCVIKIRTIHSENKPPADATKGKTADDSSDVQKINTEHFLVGYCFPKVCACSICEKERNFCIGTNTLYKQNLIHVYIFYFRHQPSHGFRIPSIRKR